MFAPFRQDLRYALRALGRSPGFAVVAIASLALGIGANATIFTVVNGLLFRTPAVHEPSRLVEVWEHDSRRGSGIGSHMQLSYPAYAHYRDHARAFSAIGAFTGETMRTVWSRSGEGEVLQGALVSGNFFSLLGLRPAVGRGFLPEEDRPATAAPVVVLSHAAWRQRFGGDPSVVGSILTLNGRAFTVVGVGPQGFTGVLAGFTPEFWAPLAMQPALAPGIRQDERRQRWLLGIARLAPGVTRDQAAADMAGLGGQLAAEYPDTSGHLAPAVLPLELVPSPFRTVFGGISGVLMAIVGLVLLIACANVANLLLARAAARRREMALRMALGASRGRLVRQALTETLLVTGIAGLAGLLLSTWATPLLLSLKPDAIPLAIDTTPDVRVLLFTLLTSLVTGLAFGLMPALHQSRFDRPEDLKDGAPQGAAPRSRLRNTLVVTQVTACMLLLVGAGLCLRSLLNARSIDPGFDPRQAVAAPVNVEAFGYTAERGREFQARLLDRVRALPGVRHAGFADHLPLGSIMRMESIRIDGYEPGGEKSDGRIAVDNAVVGPGYFEAIGTPILRGRGFLDTDTAGSAPVVVINQEMAARFWPGQEPLGRFVTLTDAGGAPLRARVVGIAKTGRYQRLGEDPRPFFYRSLVQSYEPGVQLIVRGAGAVPMLKAIAAEVRALDPRLAIVGGATLEEHMELPLFPARAAGMALGLFGALALLLAVVGLYGVVAYAVSQRTREMGIRMALGARPRDVVGLVMWQGLRLTLTGVLLGSLAAAAATRVLSNVLYGVSPTDPLSFAGVALLLVAVASAASYVPARWATRVDPLRALRTD